MRSLDGLQQALQELRQRVLATEVEFADALAAVPEAWRDSARNLVHYIGLRRSDIRPLQIRLGTLGLSSLGRLEAHVLAGIDAVLYALAHMVDGDGRPRGLAPPQDFKIGDTALADHTTALLGPPGDERQVRIMVTMPSEAAECYELVRELSSAGMDVVRINGAHDESEAWRAMVGHARRVAAERGRNCRVLFDLGGPKLRTGAIEPSPGVVRLRVRRNARGETLAPAIAWLGESLPPDATERHLAHLPVARAFTDACVVGDVIRCRDRVGRKRRLQVIAGGAAGVTVECQRGAYLAAGTTLRLERDGERVASADVGTLPTMDGSIELQVGDYLILTSEQEPGRPAERAADGTVTMAARVPCTLATVFDDAAVGDPILFDDGKFAGVIEAIASGEITVRIQRAPPGGGRLKSDKGINLPATRLSAPALSEEDLANLDFIAEAVDIVGLSFVRQPADIQRLQDELQARGREDIAVVLKIETREAFENLPFLLLAGLRSPPVGVMVARGDLGVEMGFDRLAEVQEEILWLCEAAHVPVIWATQVLENLVKTGVPSRAEVTDAAMSGRAECVMLNKGPFIVDGVHFLDNVMARMREHHYKKTPMLRRLKVSEGRYGLGESLVEVTQ